MSVQAVKSPRGEVCVSVCVQHSDAFPSVWQKHSPSNTGTVAAQSPERGGIQDGLMLIGMPFEREKMKQRWSGHYAAES